MSNVFIVSNTSGMLTITIPPGEINGATSGAAPGSAGYLTDLKLHGMGVMRWGEGLNESILRMTESFACEEKSGSPGIPKDSGDLGGNLGINAPIAGQQWFNLSNEKLYVYTGSDWILAGAASSGTSPPSNPQEGDMWYNTGITGNPCSDKQMMVYNGSSWVSVSGDYLSLCGGAMTGQIDMGGFSVTNIGPPTFPFDAVDLATLSNEINLVTNALNDYLPLAGGNMNSNSTINFPSLKFNEGNGDITADPDIRATGSMNIASESSIHMIIDYANAISGAIFRISSGSRQVGGANYEDIFTVHNNGRVFSDLPNYETLVTTNATFTNKKYVDDKAVAEGAAAVATAGSNAEDYVNDNFYAPSGHTGNGPRVWVENFAPTLPTQGDDGDLWFEI